jgi:hypothetical protein
MPMFCIWLYHINEEENTCGIRGSRSGVPEDSGLMVCEAL